MPTIITRRHFHQDPKTGFITDEIQTWARLPGTGCWMLIGAQSLIQGQDPPP